MGSAPDCSQMIPVTVLITTLNEAKNLPRCLESLKDFQEIIFIDSNSKDNTRAIAEEYGAQVVSYQWDGFYPKKRQWCLDTLSFQNPYILFIDADEVVTPDFMKALNALKFNKAGYFVKGQYIWKGRALKHGLYNNKLALFDPRKIEFPVVNDLDISGMGEMEGHYQPVLKKEYSQESLGQIDEPLLHYAYEDEESWEKRHERYAMWEAAMICRAAYPQDPVIWREALKRLYRRIPLRAQIAFIHSYILKLGFLDGRAGFDFACSRYHYYKLVSLKLSSSNRDLVKAAS